jgi:hypothetical protein
MPIPLRKPAKCRPNGFCGGLRGMIYNREQTARRARDTVCGVVGMVRARARSFDVWPGVRAELPLHQRGKGQQQLGGDQKTNRRPQECGWKSAAAAIEGHVR